MKIAALQSWLLKEGIKADLDQVTRLSVRQEISNLTADTPNRPAPDMDWNRLLLAGSVLARSEERSHQEAALRIATGAISLPTPAVVRDAGAVLLDKLSNFRSVNLAYSRRLIADDLGSRLGVSLRLEAQKREFQQSVFVRSSSEWLKLNNFQQKLWNSARRKCWLSASAPTASGKTYLVLKWLIDEMLSEDTKVAVYLAPTRALVSEIESNLKGLLNESTQIMISSLPLSEHYRAARAGGDRLILIFTQERLHHLTNALDEELMIDLLVVDEAHKIGDNKRGVILQDAIERSTLGNSKLKAIFISPATLNPEELVTDAPEGIEQLAIESDTPTVLQNLIAATQSPRNSKLWQLAVMQSEGSLLLGALQLANIPDTSMKRLAFIAAAAGQCGGTLVYANGAAESEKVAELIEQLLPKTDCIDPDLRELAELARRGVHPNFRLAPLVERGVAFHFGNMPSLIRLEIERLFRNGKILFLVCTSTLIEGVNLSCRTIVLRGPHKGKGHAMEPHDFWNLAGRAGRWGSEFQGNIICVDPNDKNAWPTGVPARAQYRIKRESDAVLELGNGMADYLESRATKAVSELKDSDRFEQVGAYLLKTFLRLGSISTASRSKRHGVDSIERLNSALGTIADGLEISAKLAARHPGVSAVGMQHLLEAFRAYQGDVQNLFLADVSSQDSLDRLDTIMRRVNKHLFPAFSPDSRVSFYALIVIRWLQGQSLAEIIHKNIEWHQKNNKTFKYPALIQSTMEVVEQVARFKAPKYLSAYVDVLHLHLNQIDRGDLIVKGLDIGTQLEFGVSSKTLLSLIELGLSRMSAVALYEKISADDLDKQACIAWLLNRQSQLGSMDLPAIILREVRERFLTNQPRDT